MATVLLKCFKVHIIIVFIKGLILSKTVSYDILTEEVWMRNLWLEIDGSILVRLH